jgi:L,D-transpeptidase catalytic domain
VAPEKESAKPQGPLIIAISIDKQKLRIYDANGFFAESPISTGMKGHPTPMGVFSVIQKQKLHHSNIYSGAPMPYMQRITWSGVAIHAGVLPGYPASHGCIRVPMAFAVKMWNWTKMGARVVVVPGELTPENFSHPLLATQKVVPQPVAASEPPADAAPAAKGDKGSDPAIKPATSSASLELRSTVGHGAKPAIDEQRWLRDQTHTADASGEMPANKASVTMSDAAPSAAPEATAVNADNASNLEAKSEPAKSDADAAMVQRDDNALSDDKPAETKSTEAAAADASAQPRNDTVKTEAPATMVEAEIEAKPDNVKPEPQKADPPKSSEKPDESVKAATEAAPDAPLKKDQNRSPEVANPAAPKPDPASAAAPKRTGQIAVFISRKDAKLYVRQNFAPLFEAPITIAPGDRPLGTHVFTAQVDKDNSNLLHWSVVSLPVPARYAMRRDEDERLSRRRKVAGAVEIRPMPVPDSPAEALDRLSIPAETMARIMEALSTGSSIIVSDQGIAAGETGEGTDFIVSLR